MRGNNVLGIIFPNVYDEALGGLTALRSMGSVPFGGRYRLIDFPLSSMVACGMSKIGVITKSNYQSLMDHVGSGRAWDLARKNDGLFIIPPFNTAGAGLHSTKMEGLAGARDFLSHSDDEYVLLTDCNVVCNIDYQKLFDFHKAKGADITIACAKGTAPKLNKWVGVTLDEDSKIVDAGFITEDGEACFSLNVIFMRKALLEQIINEAIRVNDTDFGAAIVMNNISSMKVYGYEETGFVKVIDSIESYFEINMSLLQKDNRKALFSGRKVYTKIRDEIPAIYGLGSKVKNSLVTDGCVIDGEVENSILAHGVHVAKGAVVKNCIIMNNTYISEGVHLNCVIADKEVVIKPNKNLSGDPTYPVYIGKKIVI